LDAVADRRLGEAAQGLADSLQEGVPSGREFAADDEHRGVQGVA
jgi:hypothetical protein